MKGHREPSSVAKSPDLSFGCACVQFNVKRGDVDHNRDAVVAGIRAAAAQGARLVVLPELWTTSFVKDASEALLAASRAAEEEVTRLAKDLELVVVGGGIEHADGRLYDRALLVDRGKVLGSYRKIHLFTPHAEHRSLSAGGAPLIADTSVGRIGVVICYDIRFPELVRWHFQKKVEILAVPSQWPEARAAHWRTLLKARAIENEMFVAGCNRTGSEPSLKGDNLTFPGDSRIVDPMGEPIGAGAGEDGPIVATIEPRKVRTMRRILPIHRDRRPEVYSAIWRGSWDADGDGRRDSRGGPPG